MAKHQKNFDAGVGALVVKDGAVLLGERRSVSHSGYFGIPGGRIDVGENIIEAGERELKEEAGIDAIESELTCVTSTHHTQSDQLFFGFCLVVTEFDGAIENREPERCAGWKFYDLDDLPEGIFGPHRAFIDNYVNERSFSEHTND